MFNIYGVYSILQQTMTLWCTTLLKLSLLLLSFENKSIKYVTLSARNILLFLVSSFALRMFAHFPLNVIDLNSIYREETLTHY